MQTAKFNPKPGNDEQVWYFLAEYPLSEVLTDEDKGDTFEPDLLFQTVQDLGIPLECLKSIGKTLSGFAREAMAHFNQGKFELPVYIRLFCPKKIIEDKIQTKTSYYVNAEQTVAPSPIPQYPDTKMNGGWGCFLIRRGGNVSADSSQSSNHYVDLYLYREG